MSNLSGVTTKMLPVSSEVFSNNLSAGIAAGAATVPLNSTTGYSEGDSVVLTVDPGVAEQATFVGTIQGNSVINCQWTEGNVGASHSLGATVTDYDSATHYNLVTKLLRMTHNQSGELLTSAVQAALNISSAVPADWTALANTPTVTSNNGLREHVLTFTGVDYTDRLQAGTKLRIPRTTTAPTQAGQFIAASSQYASKVSPTGITFTTTFTCEAWVYLDSYPANSACIIGRRTASSSGWQMRITTDGLVDMYGFNTTNNRNVVSRQPIPLKKWTHVAATLDMSGAIGDIYMDGALMVVGRNTTGSPSSLVQSGDLMIGREITTGTYLNAKLTNVRVWSTVRTAAQIRDNMGKALVGNEANLVACFKLNGNFNDATANANNLTASGGAIATYADNPFRAVEYAVIAGKPVFSGGNTLATVYSGVSAIPNETIGAVSYSNAATPFGFPLRTSLRAYLGWNGTNYTALTLSTTDTIVFSGSYYVPVDQDVVISVYGTINHTANGTANDVNLRLTVDGVNVPTPQLTRTTNGDFSRIVISYTYTVSLTAGLHLVEIGSNRSNTNGSHTLEGRGLSIMGNI